MLPSDTAFPINVVSSWRFEGRDLKMLLHIEMKGNVWGCCIRHISSNAPLAHKHNLAGMDDDAEIQR